MKRILPILIVCVLTFLSSNLMSREIPFTILHVSDSHSYLLGSGTKNTSLEYTHGGFARLFTLVNNIKGTDTNVLFYHSGDMFTGDLFFNKYLGSIEFEMLSRLGANAIAVGNHEFDLGPQVLYQSMVTGFQNNSIPVLSANLNLAGFPALNNFITPYIIKDYDGVKVGVFGLTFPDPSSNPAPVVISDSILEKAASTVQTLYAQGCNVIVCLSHIGASYDNILASTVPGIHIILGGHDHSLMTQPLFVPNPAGFNTIICHPGDHYDNLGKLKFTYTNGIVNYKSYQAIDVNQSVPEHLRTKLYINSLKEGVISQFGEVYDKTISNASQDISPEWDTQSSFRDSPLGNLVTDAYRDFTGTQISITAKGLMDEKIYSGAIVGNDLFRAIPYGYDNVSGLGFTLVKFSITGFELKRALELIFLTAPDNLSFFPQFSGLKFDYDNSLLPGEKLIQSSMFVIDTAFSLSTNYSVTVNSGLFGALNQLGIQVTEIIPTGKPEYTALAEFTSRFESLNYVSQGRIKEVSITGTGNGITQAKGYKLYNNYPNPFNSETIIKYSLPKNGYVRIKVYDITGRELSTLVNKEQKAGEYSIRFNGNNLSTGVYFYKLETDGFVQTKRFVLIK
ncbi:MAG: 5'-nucleotidase C-terminal domain-containing protein [Ignavibacteriota bacterium]